LGHEYHDPALALVLSQIEYHIVRWDESDRTVKILLDAERILADLEAADKEAADKGSPVLPLSAWHPEFGSWMVEGGERWV
jgi:hypothetical protein